MGVGASRPSYWVFLLHINLLSQALCTGCAGEGLSPLQEMEAASAICGALQKEHQAAGTVDSCVLGKYCLTLWVGPGQRGPRGESDSPSVPRELPGWWLSRG